MERFNEADFERRASDKEEENWDFRSFLQGCGVKPEELDQVVHRLYREEAARFDCRACARCCKDSGPRLEAEDVARMAARLGVSPADFATRYLTKDEEYDALMFAVKPCPFLKAGSCDCYPDRPRDCVEYPHLDKDHFRRRLSNMVANASVCPLVFNTFERLKDEMKPHGWRARRRRCR